MSKRKEVSVTIVNNKTSENDEITEVFALSGLIEAGQASALTNLAYSNSVQSNQLGQQSQIKHQQALNQIGVSITAKAIKITQALDITTVRPSLTALTDNSTARQLLDLNSILKAFRKRSSNGVSYD